jgi:hypothetical protein
LVRVQVMKILNVQSPQIPCNLIHLRPKYLPQHPILKHPQTVTEDGKQLASIVLCVCVKYSVTMEKVLVNVSDFSYVKPLSWTYILQCSFLNMTDHDSHPYETACKIIHNYVYFNPYIFLYQTGRQKILDWMVAEIPWFQSALNFFINV